MSKAFLKESDFEEADVAPLLISVLPPGARNYMTNAGAEKLRAELSELTEVERPQYSGNPDAEARSRLQRVDARIRYLQNSLRSAELTVAPPPPFLVVRFGATTTVRDDQGLISEYRIVGVDETDAERNWVSWLSPIARALLNRRLNEKVPFVFPRGKSHLEIIGIRFE